MDRSRAARIAVGVIVFPLGFYRVGRWLRVEPKALAYVISATGSLVVLALAVAVADTMRSTGSSTPATKAVGTSSDQPSLASNEQLVTAADYDGRWPVTVSEGILRCDEPGQVTFTADGATYWINGLAANVAGKNGWLDIKPIWKDNPQYENMGLKVSLDLFFEVGLSLCSS